MIYPEPDTLDGAQSRRQIDARFLLNPYPAYTGLREAAPIHWSEEFFGGAWVVSRHADVEMVLRNQRYSARRTGGWVMNGSDRSSGERESRCPFQSMFSRAMLFVDAPDHPRLRQILNPMFRHSSLQTLAPYIEQTVSDCMRAVDDKDEFDFIAAFARPLPARVIGRLLGLDEMIGPDLMEWSEHLAAFIGAPEPNREMLRNAQVSLVQMSAFFEQVLSKRRGADFGDDVIGHLLRAEQQGQVASGSELLAQCAMLLFAGHETTRNLLGNGLNALLRHPVQWARLKRNPDLVPGAVREILRYDSPVQYTGRRVASSHTLHGHRLERGQLVIALIGAANRDFRRFIDPDDFDITRKEGSHLSFGYGPHVCIGAGLTLLEAEIALKAIVRTWPDLGLVESVPNWGSNPVYRGLTRLDVRKKPFATSINCISLDRT